MDVWVTVKAGGNTKWPYIHAAAKRKAKKLLARCRNIITYEGIDHDKTETLQEEPRVICRFHYLFTIQEHKAVKV